jgi:hypothetical protein
VSIIGNTKMELKTAIEILEYHQEWRLGKRDDMIHEPKKLTEALDIVLSEVKKTKYMDREKLIKQLFIGKVSDIIGIEKTIELLKESTVAIDEMIKSC